MRLTIMRGFKLGLLALVAASLAGCPSGGKPGAGSFNLVGPSNAQGDAAVLQDDSGGYRIIPVIVTGCDQPGSTVGTIHVPMGSVGMSRDQGVVWVIVRRQTGRLWTISPKDGQEEYFNSGNAMKVTDNAYNAYFADPPSGAGACTDANPCSWSYDLKVFVHTSAENKTPMLCTELDPMVKIRK